jgi:hypothetical protein
MYSVVALKWMRETSSTLAESEVKTSSLNFTLVHQFSFYLSQHETLHYAKMHPRLIT